MCVQLCSLAPMATRGMHDDSAEGGCPSHPSPFLLLPVSIPACASYWRNVGVAACLVGYTLLLLLTSSQRPTARVTQGAARQAALLSWRCTHFRSHSWRWKQQPRPIFSQQRQEAAFPPQSSRKPQPPLSLSTSLSAATQTTAINTEGRLILFFASAFRRYGRFSLGPDR